MTIRDSFIRTDESMNWNWYNKTQHQQRINELNIERHLRFLTCSPRWTGTRLLCCLPSQRITSAKRHETRTRCSNHWIKNSKSSSNIVYLNPILKYPQTIKNKQIRFVNNFEFNILTNLTIDIWILKRNKLWPRKK